jgi:hypothetical protein
MKRKASAAVPELRLAAAGSRGVGVARVWVVLAVVAAVIGSCSTARSTVVPTPTSTPAPSLSAAPPSPTASFASSQPSASPVVPSGTPTSGSTQAAVRVLVQTALPPRFVPDSWAVDPDGTLWLSQRTDRAGETGLIAISSTTGTIAHMYSFPAHGVYYQQGLWVGYGGPLDTTGLTRLDPATGQGVAGVSLGQGRAIAAGFGYLWAASNSNNPGLSKIDPATARITAPGPFPDTWIQAAVSWR